jgi:hypothetical protein
LDFDFDVAWEFDFRFRVRSLIHVASCAGHDLEQPNSGGLLRLVQESELLLLPLGTHDAGWGVQVRPKVNTQPGERRNHHGLKQRMLKGPQLQGKRKSSPMGGLGGGWAGGVGVGWGGVGRSLHPSYNTGNVRFCTFAEGTLSPEY